jgi:beta-exotoxin I transport system permease protein
VTASAQAVAATRAPAGDGHTLLAVARGVLRDQRRSPFTWGIPLGLLSALELAIYPSVHKSLGKTLDSYPDAIKEAFRIETFDTPAQFVNGEMFSLIVPLAIGFFAIRAVSRPIAGYEENHWLDVVLAAPVRRRAIAGGAFAATAISVAAILAVMSALIWVAGQIFGAEIAVGDLAAALVGTWAFGLFFAGFALVACGRLSSWTSVTALSVGLLVTMYVVDVASRVADALEPAGYATAFHYYGSPLIDGLDAGHAGLAAFGVLLALAGAALFERRDVRG